MQISEVFYLMGLAKDAMHLMDASITKSLNGLELEQADIADLLASHTKIKNIYSRLNAEAVNSDKTANSVKSWHFLSQLVEVKPTTKTADQLCDCIGCPYNGEALCCQTELMARDAMSPADLQAIKGLIHEYFNPA